VVSAAVLGNEDILSPPMSGRATVIAVNPKNRYNVWLGTAGGGLWVTNNQLIGGLKPGDVKPDPAGVNFDRNWLPRWFPHNDGFGSLSIGAVVLDPASCDATGCLRAWVGTGENNLRRDTYYGNGVYEVAYDNSTEFPGWHWTRLDSANQFRYGTTAGLVRDGDELFVALSAGNTTTSVYASLKAPEPAAGYGVHRRDAAGNWTRVLATPSHGREKWGDLLLPTDIEKIPGSADGFLVGVLNDGILRTSDRGQTWCAMNPGSRLVAAFHNGQITTPVEDCSAGTGLPVAGSFDHVEIAAESGSVLFAMFGNCPSGYTDSTQRATADCKASNNSDLSPFFFKSTDGGKTWSKPGDVTGAHYSRYTHTLKAIGGGQVLWSGLEPFQLITLPAFSQIGFRNSSLHLDVHDLQVLKGWDGGNAVAYAACDGGFYAFSQGAWKAGNDSLITTEFVGIGIDYEAEPGDGFPRTNAILGGLQDNSNAAWNGSVKWQLWGPVGDGGEALIQTPTITFDSTQDNTIRRIPGFNAASAFAGGPVVHQRKDYPFYSLLVQHEATKRLFVATDAISVRDGSVAAWNPATSMAAPQAVQISPVLGTNGHDFPAIETDHDLITALAVAPSQGWRVYAGLYSGQLWRSTTPASQQPAPADWQRADAGLPAAVISSIAVHPTDHRKLWVAFSDFIDQTVWYSDDEGMSWHARSTGLPAREPVKVIKVAPDAPAKLWVGTDTGVYTTTDGGLSWQARKSNLPTVPVFDLEIDRHTQRVFAATHGRGVWMLTDQGPLLTTFEGWTDKGIWDIPIYGTGFTCTRSGGCDCSIDVEREDGTVCATGSKDALNRRIYIPQGGDTLHTDDIGSCTRCDGQPVVYGCFNGDCVGPGPLSACNAGGHRVSAVKVHCTDNPLATASVAGTCPEQSDPPSGLFEVTPPLNIPSAAAGTPQPETVATPVPAGAMTLVLTPTVMASPPHGGDRALCTALAVVGRPGEEPQLALRDAINTSAACQAAGVRASVLEETVQQGEDRPRRPDRHLALSAPGVTGAQLILSIAVAPGHAAGSCFDMSRLGVYLANQVAITQLRFPTAADGAAGGEIAISEISPVGHCEMHVPTVHGQTSLQIAAAVAAAFQAPGVPSPATCPESNNPHDIVQDSASVVAIMPTQLLVCIRDAGVGFTFGPHGVAAEPPLIQVPGDVHLAAACVGAESVATLPVCNTGKGDLLVNPIVSSDPQFTVTVPSSGYPVVISHDFCFPFQVKFRPTSPGSHQATLTIASNDLLHPLVEVKALGAGLQPKIAVTGSTDFGVASAWPPAEKTLRVCNTGGCELKVSAASIDCPDFSLVKPSFPALSAGSCLDLTVSFTPTLPGTRKCQLTLQSNDPDTPVVTRPLRGKTPPALRFLAGLAQPHGALSGSVRQGSSLDLGFLDPFKPHWAWDAGLSFSRFDGRGASPDISVEAAAAHLRYTFNPASAAQLFLDAGPSLQHFNPGDFKAGADLGLGLAVPLGRRFSLEATYRYRWTFSASPSREYSQLLAGFLISF
jgi:photosystem II stability/assembly factor-like uncharacterized protein